MLFLTPEQHQEVLRRLRELGASHHDGIPYHATGIEYTSIMICFLLQNLSAAETLLRLADSFTWTWFPVTIGYTVVRTMLETDVTAHYITKDPSSRARQYIEFGRVINKRHMDACSKHQHSQDSQWREAMDYVWQNRWASQERVINERFNAVAPRFTRSGQKGKRKTSQNWSGKTLREMAIEVNHAEAYDIFYAELSSFCHVDVHLADRFLQHRPDGPIWSQRAERMDVADVFRYASFFLTCYLKLFGSQFKSWSEANVDNCWITKTDMK